MILLKKGSRGEEVKELQKALGLTPDGIFGANTELKVKLYLMLNKLTPDGIVGQKTWDSIFSKKDDINIIKDCISTHITKKVNRPIKYLVIHFTAGSKSTKGSAKANRNVFLKREASADFCVDDEEIIQVNPNIRDYYCWAVGDGNGKYGITNSNSISIEMCSSLKPNTSAKVPNHEGWYFTDKVLDNTVKLAKWLMTYYNIPFENVIRHYDASRKACPGLIGWNDGNIYNPTTGQVKKEKNNSNKWIEFKNRLK